MLLSPFQSYEQSRLKELGTEIVGQVLANSIARALYLLEKERSDQTFRNGPVEKSITIVSVNGARYMYKALGTKIFKPSLSRALLSNHIIRLERSKMHRSETISDLKKFCKTEGQMFFHSLIPVRYCILRKLLVLARSHKADIRIILLLSMSWPPRASVRGRLGEEAFRKRCTHPSCTSAVDW